MVNLRLKGVSPLRHEDKSRAKHGVKSAKKSFEDCSDTGCNVDGWVLRVLSAIVSALLSSPQIHVLLLQQPQLTTASACVFDLPKLHTLSQVFISMRETAFLQSIQDLTTSHLYAASCLSKVPLPHDPVFTKTYLPLGTLSHNDGKLQGRAARFVFSHVPHCGDW